MRFVYRMTKQEGLFSAHTVYASCQLNNVITGTKSSVDYHMRNIENTHSWMSVENGDTIFNMLHKYISLRLKICTMRRVS